MNKKVSLFFAAAMLFAGNAVAMENHYQQTYGGIRIDCVPYYPFLSQNGYTKGDIITIKKLNEIIEQKKDGITSIDFRCYNEYMAQEKILWRDGKWRKITKLKEIRCDNSDIPKNILKIILTKNPNLTSVSLVYVRSRPLLEELDFQNIKKLETFDISGHSLTYQVDELNKIIINNPNLKDLKISFCDKFPWKKVAWEKLKNLEKLTFIFTDITKDDLEIILKKKPKLHITIYHSQCPSKKAVSKE